MYLLLSSNELNVIDYANNTNYIFKNTRKFDQSFAAPQNLPLWAIALAVTDPVQKFWGERGIHSFNNIINNHQTSTPLIITVASNPIIDYL